jgi:hypothetical protein
MIRARGFGQVVQGEGAIAALQAAADVGAPAPSGNRADPSGLPAGTAQAAVDAIWSWGAVGLVLAALVAVALVAGGSR